MTGMSIFLCMHPILLTSKPDHFILNSFYMQMLIIRM